MPHQKAPAEAATPAQTSHPEARPKGIKPGVPGTESSKAPGTERDQRGRHDQDGNSEQHASKRDPKRK